jgi:hypothetical protein
MAAEAIAAGKVFTISRDERRDFVEHLETTRDRLAVLRCCTPAPWIHLVRLISEAAQTEVAICSLLSTNGDQNKQGVSLRDIALLIDDDPVAASKVVKEWTNSKKITAQSIGKCPHDGRAQLYELSEILSDVEKLSGLDRSEIRTYRAALRAKLRDPSGG